MKQEHLAVGAFAQIAHELAEVGCDPVVLEMATRAAADEVRHSGVCGRYAAAFLGRSTPPARLRGVPRAPLHSGTNLATRALLHVVEMCCLGETFTGVYFTEMLACTKQPVTRAVIESLLEDEIDHGRLGWAYLAARAREGSVEGLGEALPAMLDRTVGRPLRGTEKAPPDDRALEAWGYLGEHAGRAVYVRTLREVIFPGLAALGVAISTALELVAQRGWVADPVVA
jgi:hypothetical protein